MRAISLDQYRHRLDEAARDEKLNRLRGNIIQAVADYINAVVDYINYFESRRRPVPVDFEILKK